MANLLIFINHLVCTACDMHCFWMFFDIAINVANAFIFKDFVDSNEDTGLLNFAKSVVDGGAKEFHCRAKAHVSINQRRYVIAEFTYVFI